MALLVTRFLWEEKRASGWTNFERDVEIRDGPSAN